MIVKVNAVRELFFYCVKEQIMTLKLKDTEKVELLRQVLPQFWQEFEDSKTIIGLRETLAYLESNRGK